MTTAVLRTSKIADLKKIVRLSRELHEQLKASDKKLQAPLVSDDAISVLDGIARDAEGVRRAREIKSPTQWAIMMRKEFVEAFLDAALRAGGRLPLSTIQEKESPLFKAFDVLIDYLPPELATHRSFGTLRLIHDPWLKKARQTYPWLKNEKK
jgi:hypothetical protein